MRSSVTPKLVTPLSHETCPLCWQRYAASTERVCDVCEAPSCPDCVETFASGRQVRCYACHPGVIPTAQVA